jgi:hypothetical protein
MAALHGLYTIDERKSDPTPSIGKMKEYVERDMARQAAFKTYKNLHGLQGKTPSYVYYFDFIHGGAEAHPQVLRKEKGDLVIKDKSEVQKAPKVASGSAAPMVFTGVAHV